MGSSLDYDWLMIAICRIITLSDTRTQWEILGVEERARERSENDKLADAMHVPIHLSVWDGDSCGGKWSSDGRGGGSFGWPGCGLDGDCSHLLLDR